MARSLIFGNRLVRSNCTVTVQRATTAQAADGTTTEATWSNVATDVEVLASLEGGSRDGSYGTDNEREQGTISGASNYLDATNVRLKITDFPTMPYYTNSYWRVNAVNRHPIGLGGLQCMRIQLKISRLNLPADNVDPTPPADTPRLDFSVATNSQYAIYPVFAW